MVGFPDFDRYVEEHGIPEEHYPAAFALWYAEATGEPVPRFEKVESGADRFLPDAEQRELDALPSKTTPDRPGRRTERPGP